jgi:hypothetical protein
MGRGGGEGQLGDVRFSLLDNFVDEVAGIIAAGVLDREG